MPPKNLPKKLKQIRLNAGLSQTSLARELTHKQSALYPSHISQFERGERQPSLVLALAYARFRGVSLEILADDELSLE
jgi:transcriptional regulator with XRE-family HTH domain